MIQSVMLAAGLLIYYLLKYFIAGSIIAIISIYFYVRYKYTFWKTRNVPHFPPKFPFGNMTPVWKSTKPLSLEIAEAYDYFKSKNHRYFGWYTLFNVVFVPVDIHLIKSILTNNFDHFVNRGLYFNESVDPLSAHLFNIENEKWRNLRKYLTPTFTTGKMKNMFNTVLDCTGKLEEELMKACENNKAINVKELMSAFTIDVIGSCAFGLDCKSFSSDESDFKYYGRKIFNISRLEALKIIFAIGFPNIAKVMKLKVTDESVSDFFMRIVAETVKQRKSSGVKRNDFMQLLIEMNENEQLSFKELAAQAFVFFIGGFETSSTTLSFALYEIAKNQQVQDSIRQEIDKNKEALSYETVMNMEYLHQVVSETLRMYPPAPVLIRTCNKEFKIPDSDLVLKPPQRIIIPIYALHHDADYFPEPTVFKPERFSKENLNSSTWLPFGDGPRNCIGARFGMLQVKVGLITMLRNYQLSLSDGMTEELCMNPISFVLASATDIMLNIKRI